MDNYNKKVRELELDGILIEKRLNDKLSDLQIEMKEYEKKLILLINTNIDTFISKVNDDQQNLIEQISKNVEKKIELLNKDIEKKRLDENSILDGRLQGYILESETRINKNIELRLKSKSDGKESIIK